MINNPYLVCRFRCFLSLSILAQALCPPPPPCPHPLSYNPLPCMWSFCLSSFPTNAIFFSLNLTAELLHTPPSTTVLLPLTILLQLPLTWPIPPTLFPPSSPSPSPLPLPLFFFFSLPLSSLFPPLPLLYLLPSPLPLLISSPLPSLCPPPFLIS